MRFAWIVLLSAACGSSSYDPHPALPAWMDDAHVFVSGHDLEEVQDCRNLICRHNENVDMIKWNGAYWLVHRTARSQVLGPNSALHVYRSDDGKSYSPYAIMPAIGTMRFGEY